MSPPWRKALMNITLAQLAPVVGDLAGNVRLIRDAIESARRDGADLLITPEMSLLGYPPRDLLGRKGLAESCTVALASIADAARGITVLVGHPRRTDSGSRRMRNAVSAVRDGAIVATYDKRLLPSYDVFDEDRHFDAGDRPIVLEVAGRRVGILVCEDLWAATDVEVDRRYGADCVAETVAAGAEVLAVASASPFVIGKRRVHLERIVELATRHRRPMVSVNQVGGHDDLLFDGASIAVAASGAITAALPAWRTEVRTIATDESATTLPAWPTEEAEDLFEALVMGVRDYFAICGLRRAVIGLSGGIDSAVTAAIAVAALGPDAVYGLLMPSRHSSPESLEDAHDLAARLRLSTVRTIGIEDGHATLTSMIDSGVASGLECGGSSHSDRPAASGVPWSLAGLPDENLQSRLRGTIVMSVANAVGAAALATGNKSELAMGYTTLYGDMIGAVAVIGDLVKTRVWSLAHWINRNHRQCGFAVEPIPLRSIEKPPSAELRPNQRDDDSLPPYAILDPLVEALVDHDLDAASAARATGRSIAEAEAILQTIDRNEHKRRQAPLVLKVTGRCFGPGRRMPLAMRQTEVRSE